MKLFKSKIVSDVAANSVDKAVYLIFNLLYLFIISMQVDKVDFGIYNWTNSISSAAMLIITFGLSPVITRYTSEDKENVIKLTSMVTLHLFIFSCIVLLIYVGLSLLNFNIQYSKYLLISICVATAGNFAFIPRQVLFGFEKYWIISKVRIIGIISKIVLGITLLLLNFNIYALYAALLFDALGNLSLWYFIRADVQITKFDFTFYKKLIQEGFPLLGMIICEYALSRMDWILLGTLKSATNVAEYSFAYRVFEFTWLPHVIVGGMLIPNFVRIKYDKEKLNNVFHFLSSIAFIIPILLFIGWTPIFDFITKNKYGSINQTTFFILISVVPLLAGISFFWNLGITLKKSKLIFLFTFMTALLNTGLNFLLIPVYSNIGAAVANSISVIFQFSLYLYYFRDYVNKAINLILKIYIPFIAISILAFTLLMGNIFASVILTMVYFYLMIRLKIFNFKLVISYLKK